MPTTIDSLQIEIQSNSTNAAQAIDDLATSLGNLKRNGAVGTAITNLGTLSDKLRSFTDAANASRAIGKLSGAMERLKNVGSVASVGNSLTKLSEAIGSLGNVNLDGVDEKIKNIANAVAPLSNIKSGGLGTMVNALGKIGDVTASLDDSKIAAFADRVSKLNEVLEPLSTRMTTVQAGLRGINSSARLAGASTRDMGENLNTASVNLASFIHNVQKAVHWVQTLVQKFSDLISDAIEWDGVSARFGRGFGPQAEKTYKWVQKLNEKMGINTQQFMQYSSVYATMLSGFGVASKDAGEMALGYTELTYDIWAGYNDIYKTYSDAADAVKSAIAGEVEPIRRAGFTIIESTLEQTAANHGLEISLANATEAQKSYLRYLTLVDQAHSQNLVGTYARELGTAEGLVRTLSQQLKSLAQTVGSLLLPILARVIPYVQAFVELLTEGVIALASIFGIEIQGVDWSSYNSGVSDATDGTAGLGDSMKDAASAAKELQNATIGIDELNVISPPSGSGGGGGGAGGFEDLDVDSLWDESIFDMIQTQVDEIKSKFKDWLPVIKAIGVALGALTLASLLKNVGDAMTKMNTLQKVFASIATLTIEAALVFTFADNYLESGNLLNLIGEALVTAAAGYLMFKAWGPGGAALALGVSIVAQLIALEMSLGDGTVSLSSRETWIQGITTAITGALGGLILSKYTGLFAKEGFAIGLAVSASLVLTAMRMGAIESGEIDSGSLEAWILELGSLITAGLAGKFLGTAFYGAGGGPAGALVGVTAGLVLNLVATIQTKGSDFGDEVSDWVNVGLTTAAAGLTAVKLWSIFGPSITTALSGLLPSIGTAVSTALGGLGTAIAAVGGGWAILAVSAIAGVLALAIVDYDFTDIGRKVGNAIGKALKCLGELGKTIWEGLKSAFNWVKENFDLESVLDVINLLFNPYTWITEIVPKMIEIGAEILPGLWKGIEDGWNNFWGNVSEFFDGFIQGVKDALGIASPSTVFAEIGCYLIDGLWEGITSSYDDIARKVGGWVENLITDMKDSMSLTAIKDRLSDMWGTATDWWDKKKKALETYIPTIGSIKDTVADKWHGAQEWWDNTKANLSTYTPSIGSIKSNLSNAWSTAKSWWDRTKSNLSTYTPNIGSIKTKLSSAWTTAKDWWNSSKANLSTYTPNIGSIKAKLSTAWDTARQWWSNTKPNLSAVTPTIGSIKDALSNAWAEAKRWWSENVRLTIPSLSFKVTYQTDGLSKVKNAIVKALKLPGWPTLSFAANGGIFDMGSLVWAGERGAEIVANASGGKTGVMNVQQMQDAVYEGVYAAVVSAMRATGGSDGRSINVYLDGRQITAAVEKRQRERGASLMGNQVYSY